MINFLFRCLDKYGSSASILFNKINFGEEQKNVIHRLFYQYKGRFIIAFWIQNYEQIKKDDE